MIRCFVVACLQVMPPKAKAKAAGKQNALQAEGWCCSGGSGSNVGVLFLVPFAAPWIGFGVLGLPCSDFLLLADYLH